MMVTTTAAQDETSEASARPQTPYTQRARYFDSGNAFNIVYPDVPAASFVAERDAALDPPTGTALIRCDQSIAMGIDFPATSPLVLASYARVRAGESLTVEVRASVVLAYVIEGSGRASQDADAIAWSTGDVFSLPGGRPIVLVSPTQDSVLWLVTNEPELQFERLAPPAPDEALIDQTHFPAETIAEELDRARARLAGQRIAGLAVVFASERLEDRRNISPSLTLAMNQLGPGEDSDRAQPQLGGCVARHQWRSLLLNGRRYPQRLAAVRHDGDTTQQRAFASQSRHGFRELAHRSGRRPALSLPHHGFPLRGCSCAPLATQRLDEIWHIEHTGMANPIPPKRLVP